MSHWDNYICIYTHEKKRGRERETMNLDSSRNMILNVFVESPIFRNSDNYLCQTLSHAMEKKRRFQKLYNK